MPGFNNLLKDCRVKEPFQADFVKHAGSMSALARRCDTLAELEAAMNWAQGTDRTTVLSIATDAFAGVPGNADWDVGVPEVSDCPAVQAARESQLAIRRKQRRDV